MAFARRHTGLLSRVVRALLRLWVVTALGIPLLGADCIGGGTDPAEERKACEDVCAVEAECELRSERDCLTALCDDKGFLVVDDGETETDLETLSSNDCLKDAQDCAEAVLCSCPDACARVDTCTGSDAPGCEDTCAALVEQAPEETYTENRCKMESKCADVPACGGVQG